MRLLRHLPLACSLSLTGLLQSTSPQTAQAAQAQAAQKQAARAQTAPALLDTALARMGGAPLARDVKRARFEMMTQWQRTAFDARPYADQPSYESHSDLRDYEAGAWRNTRRFNNGRTIIEIADVVHDSVAIRRSPGGAGGVAASSVTAAGSWTPLNVAYVDERRELFAMAPERLLLAARAARDLRLLGDTVIGGAPHARVVATVDRFRTTIFLHRGTGFLTTVRFRTAEPNDFGLVPWGEMDVELWYSGWRKQASDLVYPLQWDVRRAGKPYKRMTVIAATFNPPATPDSFVVSDSLRTAYLATATRPMHDIPLDSARIVDGRFASFGTPGAPVGAVKLGTAWVLLETGQAPSSAERAVSWLAKTDPGSPVVGALVTMPSTGNGGAAWLAARHVPVHVAPGSAPFIDAVMRGHSVPTTGVASITRERWLRVGGDSLWLEPIDLPDAPGALVVYEPSSEWLYSTAAANPLYVDLILARARANGWRVSKLGSPRGVTMALPPARRLPGDTPVR